MKAHPSTAGTSDLTNRKAELTDAMVRQLRMMSKALVGVAGGIQDGQPCDRRWLDDAGRLIIAATAHGLLDSILDLKRLIPEASVFVGTYISGLEVATDFIAGTDAPGLLCFRVFTGTWVYLSDRFPTALSPEAAAIKCENAPLPEIFIDGANNCIRAAWVCGYLADEIERLQSVVDTSDWLTIAEASRRTGIPTGTLSRRCDRGEIRGNRARGRDRRLDPRSVDQYAKKRSDMERLRDHDKDEQEQGRREVNDWECVNCGNLQASGPKPTRCQKCKHTSFRLAPSRRHTD